MKRKIVVLATLIILAFTVVTCSTDSDSSIPGNAGSSTEEISQEGVTPPSETDNQTAFNAQNDEEEQTSISTNSNTTSESDQETSNPECAFKYSLLFNSGDSDKLALTCAVAFDLQGKVFLKQGKEEEEELDPTTQKEFTKVLRENSTLRTVEDESGGESGADLLFDTFDWVRASGIFKFSSDLERNGISNQAGIKDQGDFQLDIGKILVASIRPTKLDSSRKPIVSSVNKEGRSNSFSIARLWQWGLDRLKSISFVSFTNDLFVQRAIAVEVNENTTLGKAALTTKTAEATIESNLAVYVVNRDAARKETQVFSLTDEPIRVTDQSGKVVELRRNQTVVATEIGFNGDQFEYRLCRFYKDNPELLEGLSPNQEDIVMQRPLPLQMSYRAARSLTLKLYNRNCQRPCPQPGS